MSSLVYAAGVEATAIANITSAVNSRFTVGQDGAKILDITSLAAWLRAEFEKISTTTDYVAPATAASSLNLARAVLVQSLASQLSDEIGPTRWSGRQDWPRESAPLTPSQLVSAVTSGIADLKGLVVDIESEFQGINATLGNLLLEYYQSAGLDATVPAGVVRNIETRTYILTFVTDKAEESAPSPACDLIELDSNDTVTLTPPAYPGGRNIALIRFYRSNPSNIGAAFQYVGEIAVGVANMLDDKRSEELEEECPSTTWAEPPANLRGLTEGPNGAHAGFFDNTLCPCENNIPYAFPLEYRKTVGWPIVGVGRFDQTYVVFTRGKPYYVSGADSASLSARAVDSNQACVSKRSIVNGDGWVAFASADGICKATASGISLVTGPTGLNLFDLESWRALVPSSIFAAEHDGCYLFHYDTGAATGCYSLDMATGKLTTVDATGTAFYRDLVTDTLYLASGTAIKSLYTAGTKRTASWKGKKAVLPRYANLGWLQVDSEFESAVTVKLYRDGTLTDTKVVTSRAPVRLSSVRALEHEVQVEGAAKVTSVTLASSAQELRQV